MIEWAPLIDMAAEVAFAALMPVLAWAARSVKNRFDSEAMSMITDELRDFIEEGLMYARNQAKEWEPKTRTDSAIAAEAANFVIRQAPQVMKQAGVDEEWIMRQIRGLMD